MEIQHRIRRLVPVLAVGAASAVVSVVAWYLTFAQETRTIELEYSRRGDNQANVLQYGIDGYLEKLKAVRAFFDASQHVSRDEFERFGNALLIDYPAILNIAWIPRVKREERVAHELAAARDGIVDYHIRMIVPGDELPVSPERDEYFPKFYSTEPRTSPVYGLDLNDGGMRARTVARIRDGNILSASPLLTLHIGQGDRRGFWAGVPVYAPGLPHDTLEDRRRNFRGVVQGVFQIETMVEAILANVKSPLRLYLFAADAAADDRPIYFMSHLGTRPIEARSQAQLATELHRSFRLKLGDVGWTAVLTREGTDLLSAGHEHSSIVLIFGLLLGAGLTLAVWVMRRSSDKSAAQNLRFDAALSNMAQGLMMYDPAGKLIISNRRIAELLGVPWEKWKDSVFGKTVPHTMQFARDLTGIEMKHQSRILTELHGILDSGKKGTIVIDRTNGSTYSAACAPMTDGGFVVTIEDITERDSMLRRTQAQLDVLGRLSQTDSLTSSDVGSFARHVTELSAQATGCERVNVWVFNKDESELHCIDLFETSSGRHSAGMVLNENQFRNEFQVLRASRYVDADDPLTDPRTAGYVETYLKPLGITAMLDAVISVSGKNLGLLCFEHVAKVHHWEQDEITFACQLADKIGLTLLNRMRGQAEEEMARMTRFDLVTGLANRGVFVDALEHAIALAQRDGKSFAVHYLDLDHFKDVNDTLGHPVGDLLLKSVAKRLQTIVRKIDIVARFGGDEFALIQTGIVDPADAAVLADKVLKAISEPYSIAGHQIRTGASIGIAVYGPEARDAGMLLSRADVALFRAKADGRGTYRFFTGAMDTEVQARVTLSAELRDAISSGQLFLMYQPQVDVDSGCIVGVEALCRWRHPTRGVVSPGEFIPVAEMSGLIVALGHWVLHEACRQMREWLDAGIAPPLVAVNVSAQQFKTPFELENDLAAMLVEAGLAPERIEIEITESVLMEASRNHNDALQRLRSTGLRIAIDDFGTGYSSLEYLGRFPVDRIKIAQSFILGLTPKSNNATIVKAATSLARDLGIDVVVEGVETAEQLALIRSWSGRKVQGYYFSKPLPADEATAMLKAGKINPAAELSRSKRQAGPKDHDKAVA